MCQCIFVLWTAVHVIHIYTRLCMFNGELNNGREKVAILHPYKYKGGENPIISNMEKIHVYTSS